MKSVIASNHARGLDDVSFGSAVPEDGEGGFTIIDMVVGLALLGLISVLVLEGVGGARHVRDRFLIHTDTGVATARAYLHDLIAETSPSGTVASDGEALPTLRGGPQELSVISSHAVAAQYAGLYASTLAVKQTDRKNEFDLVLEQSVFRPSLAGVSPQTKSVTRTILLANVSTLQIRYLGPSRSNPAGRWSQEWTNALELPALVAIDVVLPPNDVRRWPTLVIEAVLRER